LPDVVRTVHVTVRLGLVLTEDEITSILVVGAFAESESVMFVVVPDAVCFLCHCRARVFFVNAVSVVVVVVFFPVSRWIVPVIVRVEPGTEGFKKLF
jgi:hypothetical protein